MTNAPSYAGKEYSRHALLGAVAALSLAGCAAHAPNISDYAQRTLNTVGLFPSNVVILYDRWKSQNDLPGPRQSIQPPSLEVIAQESAQTEDPQLRQSMHDARCLHDLCGRSGIAPRLFGGASDVPLLSYIHGLFQPAREHPSNRTVILYTGVHPLAQRDMADLYGAWQTGAKNAKKDMSLRIYSFDALSNTLCPEQWPLEPRLTQSSEGSK